MTALHEQELADVREAQPYWRRLAREERDGLKLAVDRAVRQGLPKSQPRLRVATCEPASAEPPSRFSALQIALMHRHPSYRRVKRACSASALSRDELEQQIAGILWVIDEADRSQKGAT